LIKIIKDKINKDSLIDDEGEYEYKCETKDKEKEKIKLNKIKYEILKHKISIFKNQMMIGIF
jgi:hypothetical protein